MDDTVYNDIVLYVSKRQYPHRVVTIKDTNKKKAEKKNIRNKSNGFQSQDGVLYKGDKRVLRKNEVASVLASVHSGKQLIVLQYFL